MSERAKDILNDILKYNIEASEFVHKNAEIALQEIKELEEIIKDFLDCPRWIDDATVPKGGIEVAPEQVVFNASIGLLRIRRARKALGLDKKKV